MAENCFGSSTSDGQAVGNYGVTFNDLDQCWVFCLHGREFADVLYWFEYRKPHHGCRFKPASGKLAELSFLTAPNVWGYFSVGGAGGVHEYADSQFGHVFSWAPTRELARKCVYYDPLYGPCVIVTSCVSVGYSITSCFFFGFFFRAQNVRGSH
jgi:hypothetical protein